MKKLVLILMGVGLLFSLTVASTPAQASTVSDTVGTVLDAGSMFLGAIKEADGVTLLKFNGSVNDATAIVAEGTLLKVKVVSLTANAGLITEIGNANTNNLTLGLGLTYKKSGARLTAAINTVPHSVSRKGWELGFGVGVTF